MKKLDFAQTAGLLANLGVIAGIVFLAIEIRQNNEALGFQARMERQDARRSIMTRVVDNPALASALRKARQREPLAADERFLLDQEIVFRIVNWEIIFMDVQAGLLAEEAITLGAWRSAFHGGFPGMSEVWERYSYEGLYPPEFVEFVEQYIVPP